MADVPGWVPIVAALLGAGTTAVVSLALLPGQIKKAGLDRRKTQADTESATAVAAKTAVDAMLLVLGPLQASITTLNASIISLNGEITVLRSELRERDLLIARLRAGEPT